MALLIELLEIGGTQVDLTFNIRREDVWNRDFLPVFFNTDR
jgi:hypothetical protein